MRFKINGEGDVECFQNKDYVGKIVYAPGWKQYWFNADDCGRLTLKDVNQIYKKMRKLQILTKMIPGWWKK